MLAELQKAGLRASIDLRSEKIGAKIRDAQLEKLPAMLVVGQKEAESGQVSYRDRLEGDKGAMPLSAAIDRLLEENASRVIRQAAVVAPTAPEPPASEEQHAY